MTLVLVVLLFIAVTVTTADAGSNNVTVPFLFTDDQALVESDLPTNLGSSDLLKKDPYLNGPLTRVEYMLTLMAARLNTDNSIAVQRAELLKQFDRAARWAEETIVGFALYNEESGKVLAGYTIESLGRPRVPMRDSCNAALKNLSMLLPQELLGFTYHNTALGVLVHREFGHYTATLQKLASNMVHKVRISSVTDDGKTHHTLGCQRASKNAPVVYEKMSFRLQPSPQR